jgi:hypothetical protein
LTLVDNMQGVGAIPGNNHSAHHFCTVLIEGSPAGGRSQAYHTNIEIRMGTLSFTATTAFSRSSMLEYIPGPSQDIPPGLPQLFWPQHRGSILYCPEQHPKRECRPLKHRDLHRPGIPVQNHQWMPLLKHLQQHSIHILHRNPVLPLFHAGPSRQLGCLLYRGLRGCTRNLSKRCSIGP